MKSKNIMTIALCFVALVAAVLIKSMHARIYEGFQHESSQKKVVIIGCAKDIGKYLEKTIQKLIELRNTFHPDSKIVVAENDSKDETKDILKKYSNEVTTLTYDGKVTMPTRTERLAFLRNELMNYAHTNYPAYDYIINADLDIITHSLDVPNVQKILTKWAAKPWDALFANSHPYYDIWALRSKDIGCVVDCWDAMEHDSSKDFNKNIGQHFKTIPTNAEPILVDSAFNGFGIYRMSSTRGCVYDGVTRTCSLGHTDTSKCNKERCEHVAFHENMKQKGHDKLYIVPELMVTYQY